MEEVFDIVYLFGFSPRYGNELSRLIPILKNQSQNGKQIGIIFIHDGVIGANSKGKMTDSMSEIKSLKLKRYVMIPDLTARGIPLEHVQEDVHPIEYMELVDIIENSHKVISWM
ncbi:MAG: sulfurtransferase complex subunit TusB [Candidatus Hodarchaeota archaeon]